MEIVVYGADVQCASCVGAPSSKGTYEWLEAALKRKYPKQLFFFRYVDIFNPKEKEDVLVATQIVEEEWFYPVVIINGHVAGEGIIQLREIEKVVEKNIFINPPFTCE